jgi:AraC-like DNA-binding protein
MTLDAVARAVGQSPRSLARKFAAELGLTWSEAQTRARMLAAIERLTAGQQSVAEVALAVGYSSPSAFSDAFRKLTGQTPRDFRKTCLRA